MPEYLTIGEAAIQLRLSEDTVRRYIRDGYLPGATKLPRGQWRIPKSAVEALLKPSAAADA